MRDDSIWKNLALAFGDGLAFGVGVKLSQGAAARMGPGRAEVRTLAERLNEIENRIERARQNNALPGQFNQKVVEAVVSAVDARLREQADRLESRLSEELAGLRAEFSEQISITRKHADDDNQVLRGQMTALHRQFAESVARLVDEQIAATVEVRMAPLEAALRQEIREQTGRAAGLAAAAADAHVAERMQPVESAVDDLSKRLEENDRNTLELVLALGQLCLQTAERLSGPVVEMIQAEAPPPLGPGSEAAPAAAEAERVAAEPPSEVLAHLETKPAAEPAAEMQPEAAAGAFPASAATTETARRLWRIPLVSSFFVATTGLLLLHYL